MFTAFSKCSQLYPKNRMGPVLDFPPCAASTGNSPFEGGDIEQPGVLEAALAARAPNRELIFLSVGDTRDHRRQYKDPALRTISQDFLLNLLANLKQLELHNTFVLTTQPLCRQLQKVHCLFACGWTSLWEKHPGLGPWGLRPGDMFLMWAQQWHYIARALLLGYSVLRADTDVYLAEDPYLVLHGPLLAPFSMVVQQDFGGPLGGRPRCERVLVPLHAAAPSLSSTDPAPIGSCGKHHGTALLNIGLVYVRAAPPSAGSNGGGGGVLAVINGTSQRFLAQLNTARTGASPAQPQHVESLIDQPLMREVVSSLSVAEPAARKSARAWMVVPGSAAPVYAASACALRDTRACQAVASQRARTAFLAQLVQPHRGRGRAERIALAPDWLFGRGCLLHVRQPMALLQATSTAYANTQCELPPVGPRRAMPAPGPAVGVLVATHFVYSMALKRKRSFKAFGWDAADGRNRTRYPTGMACWRRARKGILFGHTFFAQTDAKAVLCAMPSGDEPECACCATLKNLEPAATSGLQGGTDGHSMMTTGGHAERWMASRATKLQEGCQDYQMFWD
jgi:hypothetical protein